MLKSEAIARGYPEDLWSELVQITDPLTGAVHEERRQFEYAISCRELLDITPTWQKACEGHDVAIPIALSSYSVVPPTFPMAVTWHRSNLTQSGLASVKKEGFKTTWGGRFQIHTDPFWKNSEEWPYGLTAEGAHWIDPNTGEVIIINTPYNYEVHKKRRNGEKTYIFGIDWKGLYSD